MRATSPRSSRRRCSGQVTGSPARNDVRDTTSIRSVASVNALSRLVARGIAQRTPAAMVGALPLCFDLSTSRAAPQGYSPHNPRPNHRRPPVVSKIPSVRFAAFPGDTRGPHHSTGNIDDVLEFPGFRGHSPKRDVRQLQRHLGLRHQYEHDGGSYCRTIRCIQRCLLSRDPASCRSAS